MEIEKKYLVKELPSLDNIKYCIIEQAYISSNPTIRIRKSIFEDKTTYILCIKSNGLFKREEYEINISEEEYLNLLNKADSNIIYKKRYFIPLHNNLIAELDIYEGNFRNLVTVEVEFESEEDANSFIPPLWFSDDVTYDKKYKNGYLAYKSLGK